MFCFVVSSVFCACFLFCCLNSFVLFVQAWSFHVSGERATPAKRKQLKTNKRTQTHKPQPVRSIAERGNIEKRGRVWPDQDDVAWPSPKTPVAKTMEDHKSSKGHGKAWQKEKHFDGKPGNKLTGDQSTKVPAKICLHLRFQEKLEERGACYVSHKNKATCMECRLGRERKGVAHNRRGRIERKTTKGARTSASRPSLGSPTFTRFPALAVLRKSSPLFRT